MFFFDERRKCGRGRLAGILKLVFHWAIRIRIIRIRIIRIIRIRIIRIRMNRIRIRIFTVIVS